MTITRRLQAFSIAAVLLSLVGILASCGGSTATGSTGGSLPTHATINIPKADRFEPFLLEIAAGGTVTWTNQESDGHTVLTDPGVTVQFKFVVPANGQVSYTFDKPGIYPYFCDAHAQWNSDIKRVEARQGSSEYPAAMEGVVFVLP